MLNIHNKRAINKKIV